MTRRAVVRLGKARDDDGLDAIAVEEPLEIRIDGETIGVTMRTPGDDARLALGFLFAEGIVGSLADVGTISHCGRPGEDGYGNVLEVRSGPGTSLDADRILEGRRFVPTSSACGVCGRRSIDELIERAGAVEGGAVLESAAVYAAMERLRALQPRFERTGGIHAAAVFDAEGEPLAAFEDVGRHNAVDKVVGELLRQGSIGGAAKGRQRPALLVVSGRAGFEIVQKAAAAKLPIVASVSAPSSLAVDLAQAAGITLAGFVRQGSMNVYTHAWRIRDPRARAAEATAAASAAGAPEGDPELSDWGLGTAAPRPAPPAPGEVTAPLRPRPAAAAGPVPLAREPRTPGAFRPLRDPLDGIAASLTSPAFTEPAAPRSLVPSPGADDWSTGGSPGPASESRAEFSVGVANEASPGPARAAPSALHASSPGPARATASALYASSPSPARSATDAPPSALHASSPGPARSSTPAPPTSASPGPARAAPSALHASSPGPARATASALYASSPSPARSATDAPPSGASPGPARAATPGPREDEAARERSPGPVLIDDRDPSNPTEIHWPLAEAALARAYDGDE